MELWLSLGVLALIYCFIRVLDFSKRIDTLEKKLQAFEKKGKDSSKALTMEKTKPVSKEEVFSDAKEWGAPPPPKPIELPKVKAQPDKPSIQTSSNISPVPPPQKPALQVSRLQESEAWVWIKENWTGFLGVAAVVLGVAFAGAYIGFFATPLIRFMMITAVGIGFISLSLWLRTLKTWAELGAWLQAGGGAIILLAFLGGGYFEGLRFYDSPAMGFVLMAIGLSINMALAYFKPKETLSASHVVFSLLALSVAPSIVPILWAGALICVCGVFLSHRRQWNLNLGASLIAFTILSHLWRMENSQGVYWHGILATMLVFIPSLLVHYRHIYKDKDIYASCWSHIIAWGLFGYNLYLYQQGFYWVSIPLALGAFAAIGMSLYAKRQHAPWLFAIDFLVGEILLVLACLTLSRFDVSHQMITWLICALTFVFLALSLYQKWYKVVGLNILFSSIALFAYILLLFNTSIQGVYSREMLLGMLGLFYTGYWLASKNDELSSVEIAKAASLYINMAMVTIGSMLLIKLIILTSPLYGFWVVALLSMGMMFNKSLMRISEHKVSLLVFILISLIASWCFIPFAIIPQELTAAKILWQSFYLCVLPTTLMVLAACRGQLLHYEVEEAWFVDYWLYVLGIHLAIFMIWLTHPVNAFLPSLLMLAASIGCMELAKSLSKHDSVKYQQADMAFNNMGLWALIIFLACFALDVSHSSASIFSFFSIRVMIGLAGVVTGFVWMFNKRLNNPDRYLLSPTIGFDIAVILLITLWVLELSAPMHGIGYSLLGILILTIPKLTNQMPHRKYLYSFGLLLATLIHVPVVSSHWASPLSNWYQTSHVTGIVALGLSCVLATILARQDFAGKEMSNGAMNFVNRMYHVDKPLLSYLPIFISLALFLYWRFDGAVLTALWVGEVFACVLLGIYLKHKNLIKVAYGFLALCLARLVVYDFAQSDMLMKAFVFVVVGLLMIGMHVTYKKLRGRLE